VWILEGERDKNIARDNSTTITDLCQEVCSLQNRVRRSIAESRGEEASADCSEKPGVLMHDIVQGNVH
jgi:hypothetical protein